MSNNPNFDRMHPLCVLGVHFQCRGCSVFPKCTPWVRLLMSTETLLHLQFIHSRASWDKENRFSLPCYGILSEENL